MKLGLHIGHIRHPVVCWIWILRVEVSISIAVDVDTLELTTDNARNHLAKMLITVSQLNIGPHLSTRITQPHSRDIARINESILLAIYVATIVDRSIQRVREAVDEHPTQLIVGEHCRHLSDLLLDSLRSEVTHLLGRTTVSRIVRPSLSHSLGVNLCHLSGLLRSLISLSRLLTTSDSQKRNRCHRKHSKKQFLHFINI